MKQVEKWQEQYKTIPKTRGGYSDFRLWPCYLIYITLILMLFPFVGAFLAFLIITIPAVYVAFNITKIENKNTEAMTEHYQFIYDTYYRPRIEQPIAPQIAVTAKKANPTVQIRDIQKDNLKLTPHFNS